MIALSPLKINYILMKHISFLLLLSAIIFSSCKESLDTYPESKLSPETFFKTEEELLLYSNKFYIDILPTAADIYEENADAIIITPLKENITGQRTVPGTGGGWSWSALRRVNFLLENSKNCKDLAVRNKYDALAKFFRAYFYFQKVQRFGDVPWYNKVLGSADPDLYKPRDSRTLVMDSIMRDLDFAIEYLSPQKDAYRVNKWTALALKSRVGLFEGTFRKYHNLGSHEAYLDASISAAEKLMTEGGYSLYTSGQTPYQSLFATQNAIAQEIILSRKYDAGLSLFHDVQYYENASTRGRPGLSKRIVNSYLTSQGTRFTDLPGAATMQFYEETQNRDPRLAQTIRTPGYKRMGSSATVAPNLAFTLTGYHLIKYAMEVSYDVSGRSSVDLPIVRLAEVYLNYAEAKAERGTLTQGDIDKSIRLLRSRVGMPNLDMAAANSNPDPYLSSPDTGYPNVTGQNKGVILEIRRERTIELIMEGFRYYDIMRWKEGKSFEKPFLGAYFPGIGIYDLDKDGKDDVSLYKGAKPATSAPLSLEVGVDINFSAGTHGYIINHNAFARKWDENKDYLYPLPVEDRSLSGGKLTQNPGWIDGLSF
jgi:hypothetical protein